MSRTIQSFKNFDEAAADEKRIALSRTPEDRVMLLHKLIHVWMKFPKSYLQKDKDIPTIKRIKRHAR